MKFPLRRLLAFWFWLVVWPAVGEANGISVSTLSATGITSSSAIVNGIASGGIDAAAVTVEFGTTPAFGRQQSVGTTPAGFTAAPFSAVLTGLPVGQTIYYRFTAQSVSASAQGGTNTFTTLPLPLPGPPTISSATVVAVGGTFARIVVRINPNLRSTTITANAGNSEVQPTSLFDGGDPQEVELTFHRLTRSRAYSFEIVAANALGTARFGGAFSTFANVPPTAGNVVGYVVRGGTAFVRLPIGDQDDDEPLAFSVEEAPKLGTVTFLRGSLIYTAGPLFRSTDSLQYVVRDSLGAEARGTLVLRNFFLAHAGNYDAALVHRGTGQAVGVLRLAVSTQGEFTGILWKGGARYPLLGSFRLAGRFDEQIGEGTHAIRLQLAIDPITGALSGSVSDLVQTWSVLAGGRAVAAAGLRAGRYTAEIDAPISAINREGHGWAVLDVLPGGMARAAGQLAGGETLLASTFLREDGSLLLPVASSSGFALLHLFFTSAPDYDFAGGLYPFAPPADLASAPRPSINGSRYTPPGIAHSLLKFTESTPPVLDLTFGESFTYLPRGAGAAFSPQNSDAFVVQPQTVLTANLRADLALGVFRGRAARRQSPDTGVRFQGVFLQKRNLGTGLFLGLPLSPSSPVGAVKLLPR